MSKAHDWWHQIKNPKADTIPEDVLEAMREAWERCSKEPEHPEINFNQDKTVTRVDANEMPCYWQWWGDEDVTEPDCLALHGTDNRDKWCPSCKPKKRVQSHGTG